MYRPMHMCAYVYIGLCVCRSYTRVGLYMYVCRPTCVYAYARVGLYVCTSVYAYMKIYIRVYLYTYR